ncbi:MAG TPA: CHAD domain-containing protein [Gemmataceae bacterium]|nr:CHAD domain-containing protein [Gemmataceae bacterium]
MADGKWIEGLTADTPLAQAAETVLALRLHTVAQALPKASQEADKDVENVHQLRVATRRADAALRIFELCLPKKIHKTARNRLKRMRRAAGAARDWDVFLIALAERRPNQAEKEQAGLNYLFGYAYGQRTAAQVELEKVGNEEHAGFDAFRRETTAAVHAADGMATDANLVDWARPLLAGLLREFEWTATGDLEDYAHLHQVRIAGKRLRYAMEVFADCFSLSFRESLYPRVEEMQDILGRANDSHVAEERLSDLRRRMKRGWMAEWKRVQAGVESLLRFHQRRLPQERKRFLQWWGEWIKAGPPALTAMLGGEAAPALAGSAGGAAIGGAG